MRPDPEKCCFAGLFLDDWAFFYFELHFRQVYPLAAVAARGIHMLAAVCKELISAAVAGDVSRQCRDTVSRERIAARACLANLSSVLLRCFHGQSGLYSILEHEVQLLQEPGPDCNADYSSDYAISRHVS